MAKSRYVFVYRFMRTGGTENLIVKLASQIKSVCQEVYCVCEECGTELRRILIQSGINVDKVSWEYVKDYCRDVLSEAEVKIITFEWHTFLDFYLADGIGKKTFLYVVHPECVKGETCEGQEEKYHKDLIIYDKSEMGILLNNLGASGHIAVMDNIIKSEMEDFFNRELDMPIIRICVDLLDDWQTVSRNIPKRYYGKKIVVAARADFPFKGYILGMLKWADEKLNKLGFNLEVVSYGADYKEIVSAYEKLNIQAKEKVELRGELSYKELRNTLFDAFVFVGMGTSVIDSAEMGIPVIPVKPNEYNIICNGRFDMNSNEVCAGDIYPYKDFDILVQELVQMDIEEYTDITKKTFDNVRTIYSSEKIASELIFALEECSADETFDRDQIMQFELKGIEDFEGKIRKIKNADNERKIVIYGAGIGGRDVYFKLNKMGIDVYCFVDKNYEDYDCLYGLPVISPHLLDVNTQFVIVSLKKNVLEITKCLEKMGYKLGEDYIYPHCDLVKGIW